MNDFFTTDFFLTISFCLKSSESYAKKGLIKIGAKKKKCVSKKYTYTPHLQAPDAFRLIDLNPPRQLVIISETGLQSRRHSRPSPQFSRNFEYKIYHISTTENHKNLKINVVNISEHCAIFWSKKMVTFLTIF